MNSDNESTILTPCINVCVVDQQTSQCIGCGRDRKEIAAWMSLTSAERANIMKELPERVATLTKRKTRQGGARARRQNTKPVIINFKGP